MAPGRVSFMQTSANKESTESAAVASRASSTRTPRNHESSGQGKRKATAAIDSSTKMKTKATNDGLKKKNFSFDDY